jgi:uncharacterized protein (DUF1778 family)
MSDKKPDTAGNIHLSIRVSQELWQLIQQAMRTTQHRSLNEFIRTCIRAYIDETADIVGSRRHFSNRMNERMDRLEALILWNSLQAQMLTARGLFTVLDELNPEAQQDPPGPDVQLARALEASKKAIPQFLSDQAQIVAELEAYRRKKQKDKE